MGKAKKDRLAAEAAKKATVGATHKPVPGQTPTVSKTPGVITSEDVGRGGMIPGRDYKTR